MTRGPLFGALGDPARHPPAHHAADQLHRLDEEDGPRAPVRVALADHEARGSAPVAEHDERPSEVVNGAGLSPSGTPPRRTRLFPGSTNATVKATSGCSL